MKLIDADVLRKDVLDMPNCYNGYSDTYDKSLIIGLIDEQIVVDAVTVVRCCDCLYAEKYAIPNGEVRVCRCRDYPFVVMVADYCSRGERK